MTAALKGNLTRLSLLPWKGAIHVTGCLGPAFVYRCGGCADRMEATFPTREGPHDGQHISSPW